VSDGIHYSKKYYSDLYSFTTPRYNIIHRMNSQSTKAKGRRWQQKIVRMILDCFPSLEPDDVRSTSMGASGPDVQLSPAARELFDVSIEAKNQERIGIRRCWEQTVANAKDHIPLLFMTWNRGDELVCMKASYYFKLLRRLEDERIDTDDATMV